ncbi:hypothetical protein GRI40_08940 [Altererythrobacter aerius]|uniref:Uncharacterized protein n=1 Tax=Tsuneonella aeria TaxID=1837929 RepID=A0A6I4TFE0_9SPHN|nr:hypothetical protein [Tsuneonella aeria]MXO75337.1 hypothetical protein [Tsuneonella aeria]
MSSISNRLGKLEREQAASGGSRRVADMTDRELIADILEGEGIPPTEKAIDEHLRRFNETGVLPGRPAQPFASKPEGN